ncbi:MAG: beta-phosphoglucomutase [Firmicutes bacterium]|nr:beta-phosphoglucomutase [Bacillota bacterium]
MGIKGGYNVDLQLAIFDLDGVIVDTAKYHYLAWKRLGDELGIEFTEQDNERLKGVSRMRSLDIILELGNQKKTQEEKEALTAKKNSWYVESILQMDASQILPGVLDFLEDLKARSVKIALGSASKNARTILERVQITNYFDAIIDGNLVSKAKPDPEVFLLGATKLGVKPTQTVVFEDAQAGIEAALNAGMYTVGVGDRKILSEAHVVISSFESLNVEELFHALTGQG